jgi:hypothetical protein
MGATVSFDVLHSGILDTDLFAKELNFLLEPVAFDLPLELRVYALGSPALRQCQGGPGKGDDLDYCITGTTGPASGQRKRTRR